MDPIVREKLYGADTIQPFTDLYLQSQRKLQKRFSKSRKKVPHTVKVDTFHIGDEVLLNLAKTRITRYYDIPRKTVFKISNVRTDYHPFLYQLDTLDGKRKLGWFYSRELVPCNWKLLQPTQIHKSKVVKGKKYNLVSYFNDK